MFWYSWPSWITELLGGTALSLALFALFRWVFRRKPVVALKLTIVGGVVVSVFYELVLDPNHTIVHNPSVDIVQRACGQIVGLLILAVFTKDDA